MTDNEQKAKNIRKRVKVLESGTARLVNQSSVLENLLLHTKAEISERRRRYAMLNRDYRELTGKFLWEDENKDKENDNATSD